MIYDLVWSLHLLWETRMSQQLKQSDEEIALAILRTFFWWEAKGSIMHDIRDWYSNQNFLENLSRDIKPSISCEQLEKFLRKIRHDAQVAMKE